MEMESFVLEQMVLEIKYYELQINVLLVFNHSFYAPARYGGSIEC